MRYRVPRLFGRHRAHGLTQRCAKFEHMVPSEEDIQVRLQDRYAVITGAGRNIGREIALLFAREGAHIAVNVRSNIEEGKSGGG